MFRRRQRIMERVSEVLEKFRQKGALSPEKALSPEELGLPPQVQGSHGETAGTAGSVCRGERQILPL